MWGEGRKEDGVNAAWQRQKDGYWKMGWGRWAAGKTGMEGHGPGKVGVGKRGGDVVMG